jgi:ribosome-associated protein
MKHITIAIETEFIPAMNLLKLAGAAATGGEAGMLILDGKVRLDGTVFKEKRKKVHPGQVVSVDGADGPWVIIVTAKMS